MARPLRIEFPGAICHLTASGNARAAIFCDDVDWRVYLSILGDCVQQYSWICHGYCLMDNHYHLLTENRDGILSQGMRQLNGIHTQKYDRRLGSVGHVSQERNRAIANAHLQHGYFRQEIASHVRLHYSAVGRIVARRRKQANSKT